MVLSFVRNSRLKIPLSSVYIFLYRPSVKESTELYTLERSSRGTLTIPVGQKELMREHRAATPRRIVKCLRFSTLIAPPLPEEPSGARPSGLWSFSTTPLAAIINVSSHHSWRPRFSYPASLSCFRYRVRYNDIPVYSSDDRSNGDSSSRNSAAVVCRSIKSSRVDGRLGRSSSSMQRSYRMASASPVARVGVTEKPTTEDEDDVVQQHEVKGTWQVVIVKIRMNHSVRRGKAIW